MFNAQAAWQDTFITAIACHHAQVDTLSNRQLYHANNAAHNVLHAIVMEIVQHVQTLCIRHQIAIRQISFVWLINMSSHKIAVV